MKSTLLPLVLAVSAVAVPPASAQRAETPTTFLARLKRDLRNAPPRQASAVLLRMARYPIGEDGPYTSGDHIGWTSRADVGTSIWSERDRRIILGLRSLDCETRDRRHFCTISIDAPRGTGGANYFFERIGTRYFWTGHNEGS